METTSTTAVTSTTSSTQDRNTSGVLGKDDFLKLLVAQLKYQNPMDPQNGSEFLAQSAQFTMVEKLQELAKQSSELLSSERTAIGSALLGKKITATGSNGVDVTGVVKSIRMTSTGPLLKVEGQEIAVSAVKEVQHGA